MGEFFLDHLFTITVVYGLSFFGIFFAIALQKGHTANFELINTFLYLAGFGLMHGIGDVVFLLPAIFETAQAYQSLIRHTGRYFIAGSYIFLYLFGLSVLLDKATQKAKWIVYASPIITIVFLVITINPIEHAIRTEVIYRLFLGFPSALLASLALLKMSKRFSLLNLHRIVFDFRGAALAFSAYAIFTGLFFVSFPESILVLGVPVQLLRALAVTLIAVLVFRIMAVFKL